MWFSKPSASVLALSTLLSLSLGATPSDSKDQYGDPCTIHSSFTGSFYDVRPLTLKEKGTKTQAATNESYHSRGWDYGANFTINICAPVVEPLTNVDGVTKSRLANISAFYTDPRDDTIYSLGEVNQNLTVRGRKLLLNYTNGSPCPELDEDGDPISASLLDVRKILDGDNRTHGSKGSTSRVIRKKSTILSFICDTSSTLSTTPRISFVASPDHCSYIFEVRSRYACAGATPAHEAGTLGPAGVFAMIVGFGVLAYLMGGIVYQRNVMHQRGWRQLPNYSLWSGIFSFISVSQKACQVGMILTLFRTCLLLSSAHVYIACLQLHAYSTLREVATYVLVQKIEEMAAS